MKTFIFLALFASVQSSQAASDYIKKIGFYGENAEQTKADCKSIETHVRERMHENELRVLGTEKNLINIKAEYEFSEQCPGEGSCFTDHICNLHFISFTPALGFEEIKSETKKNLGSKKAARLACTDDVTKMLETDPAVVYSRTSRSTKLFKGGNQCNAVGIRVVPMLTN